MAIGCEAVIVHLALSVSILGILFSVLVIVIFSKKQMKSAVRCIFLCIGFIDLATGLIRVYMFWLWYYNNELYWRYLHNITMLINLYLYNTPLLLDCLLTGVRYVAVAHPLQFRNWCSQRRIHSSLIGCLAIGVVLVIPPAYSSDDIINKINDGLFYTLLIVAITASLILLTCLLSLVLAVKLAVAAYKNKQRRIGGQMSAERSNRSRTRSCFRSTMVILSLDSLVLTAEIGRILILTCYYRSLGYNWFFTVALSFFFHYFYFHNREYSLHSPCSFSIAELLFLIFRTISYVNVCAKFFIYYVLDENFRKTANGLLSGCPLFS